MAWGSLTSSTTFAEKTCFWCWKRIMADDWASISMPKYIVHYNRFVKNKSSTVVSAMSLLYLACCGMLSERRHRYGQTKTLFQFGDVCCNDSFMNELVVRLNVCNYVTVPNLLNFWRWWNYRSRQLLSSSGLICILLYFPFQGERSRMGGICLFFFYIINLYIYIINGNYVHIENIIIQKSSIISYQAIWWFPES